MRVLFLTHRLPYAPDRGDRVRAFHIARTLATNVELEIVSLAHDSEELAHVEEMTARGLRVSAFLVPHVKNRALALRHLAGRRPLTHVLLDAPGIRPALNDLVVSRRPDVVLAYCSGMVRFAVEPPLRDIPLVIDLVDVDSAKWAALADASRGPRRWIYRREASCLSAFECRTVTGAFHTVVVNERELEILKGVAPRASVSVVSNGVDRAALAPPQSAPRHEEVVFCGVMNYAPNVQAVVWFAENVWPYIRRRRADAIFRIIGSDPTADVSRLAHLDKTIVVTGRVPDVRPYLWRAAVSVAPVVVARGIQNKVLEAIAAGLPTVVTPQVFAGLPREAHPACRQAESSEGFAEEVLKLLSAPEAQREAIVRAADLSSITWESRLAPLEGILTAAADSVRSNHRERSRTR